MLYTFGTPKHYYHFANKADAVLRIGFMGFVGSLKKQFLKQQFGLYGWVHMSLLIVVVSR